MTPPPRDVFAAAARNAIERHDEWDSPHSFETLHWDGCASSCCGDGGIHEDGSSGASLYGATGLQRQYGWTAPG